MIALKLGGLLIYHFTLKNMPAAKCKRHQMIVEKATQEFSNSKGRFREQWLLGIMDSDLVGIAETTVPPGDVKSVRVFRLSRFD